MAMNPMQRRARNSFLTGMLVTLIVMAIVVVLLLSKINQLNEDKEKLIAAQKKVYVAAEDIKSGGEITLESLKTDTVQTSMDIDNNALTADDFTEVDEEGNEYAIEYVSRVNLPAGTIITKDMVDEVGDEITPDQRLQEFNMIVLPSELRNGDFVDIRFKLASGADYIVVSKKKVLQCTADTIWLKLTEDEMLSLGNAIVETYKSAGSKLYATTYVEAGIQQAAVPTYPVNPVVMGLITSNPNVVNEAKNALWERYNNQTQVESRGQIDSTIVEDNNSVQTGVQTEISATQTARSAFVSELEGTGEIGRTVE